MVVRDGSERAVTGRIFSSGRHLARNLRRHGIAAAAAAGVVVTIGAVLIGIAGPRPDPAAAHSSAITTAHARNRSGLPWRSGAYLPGDTRSVAAAFGRWRGHPLDVIDEYSARATWQDIVDPAYLYHRWHGSPSTMSFGVAMLPEAVAGVSLRSCAAGAYDAYWREFGSAITSYGLGHSIIRLGWEFNGNWYIWQASHPATWAACWRRIVASARATAPGLRWDWNVNRGPSGGLADPARAYPGDAYVSMIGIDSYDWYPAATTAAGWQSQLNSTQGLNYWLTFAEAHGKQLSVPEWGSRAAGPSAGGDDPAFVHDMRAFFAANAAHIAFEANFQAPPVPGSLGVTYWPTTTVPKAAAAYRAEF